MMIPASLLVATALTTLSESTPLSYSTYQIGELPAGSEYLPYLTDGREIPVNEIFWPQITEEENIKAVNNTPNNIKRTKRIHSLSVTNSIDVLRERILLELARRKAHQNQQQINANRQILNNIGKRSMQDIPMNIPQLLKIKNERMFDNPMINENPERSESPAKDYMRNRIDWYDMGDVSNLYEKNDQQQQMEANELGLL